MVVKLKRKLLGKRRKRDGLLRSSLVKDDIIDISTFRNELERSAYSFNSYDKRYI